MRVRYLAAVLLLALIAAPAAVTSPPARAAEAPPYVEYEVTIPVPAGHTLAGTLTIPAGSGPHPAVVTISGSGAQDRDESIPMVQGYRPFRVIADYLARDGIAVLRYDDRGTGKSTGDHDPATSADFAEDAEAAWRFLRARRDIDAAKIGLFGHSEGGLIAAMIAGRNRQVALVVSMAGPGVIGYDLIIRQNERALRAMGLTEPEIAQQIAQLRPVLDLIRAEQWDRLRALMVDLIGRQLAALPPEQRTSLPPLERIVDARMALYRGWMRFFLTHDPAQDWARVRVPVLALFGVLDVQVDLWQNRGGMLRALERGGNGDVTVVVFPRANHLFQQATTGSLTEYAGLPPEFVPGFLDTISVWIRNRF